MAVPQYADPGVYDYGEQAHGDAGMDQLRRLYLNCQALAGDDGTGYGTEDDDAANGLPVGRALVTYRAPVMWAGAQRGIGWTHGVTIDETVWQMIYKRRQRDFLCYRTTGAELVYIDADGEEATKRLEDFDDEDDKEYWILDLDEVPGLQYGMWYFIRCELLEGEDNVLGFAEERTL